MIVGEQYRMTYQNDKLVLAEEPYVAIQGEGTYVGIPMLFVRLQGCNVGCVWCDSYYTWSPYNIVKVPDTIMSTVKSVDIDFKCLVEKVVNSGVSHVWFTGGEPTLQAPALAEYMKEILPSNYRTYHLCTAGWMWNEFLMRTIHSIVIDVKPPSSQTQSKQAFIDKCMFDLDIRKKTQLKVVVANTDEDRAFAKELVEKYSKLVPITMQPLYASEPEFIEHRRLVDEMSWTLSEYADWFVRNFSSYDNVRLGLQLHKHLYPDKMRGT